MSDVSIEVLTERLQSVILVMNEREKFYAERDRRYTEVNAAVQKALEIKAQGDRETQRVKEEGDGKALVLARDGQHYRDQMHNNLLGQLKDERGLYATKADLISIDAKIAAQLAPVMVYVASQQGEKGGRASMMELFMRNIPALLLALIAIVSTIVAIAYAIRKG